MVTCAHNDMTLECISTSQRRRGKVCTPFSCCATTALCEDGQCCCACVQCFDIVSACRACRTCECTGVAHVRWQTGCARRRHHYTSCTSLVCDHHMLTARTYIESDMQPERHNLSVKLHLNPMPETMGSQNARLSVLPITYFACIGTKHKWLLSAAGSSYWPYCSASRYSSARY
jgi:hypothetical protein